MYLDKKVEMPAVVIAACWGVAADDVFAFDICLYRDMLSNRKSKDVIWIRQSETISVIFSEHEIQDVTKCRQSRVGRNNNFSPKRVFLPFSGCQYGFSHCIG
jgi:hypothetical protein